MQVKKFNLISCIGVNELPEDLAGVAVYKGLIVLFDSDFDDRIFLFLKSHYHGIVPCCLGVYEHGGVLTLYINKEPNDYTKGLLSQKTVDIIADKWTMEVVAV